MKAKQLLPALSVLAVGLARPARGGTTLTTLATFAGTNGANPYAGLIADSSGNLYGTTYRGGANNDGTAFELSGANHQTFTQLVAFNGSNGADPQAALSADSSGNLYGTTAYGGAYGDGVVFELSGAAHQTAGTLASFTSATGTNPAGPLVVNASGVLYGTTYSGGAAGYGTAFYLAQNPGLKGGIYSLGVLATFNGSTGTNPIAGLTSDSAGNLYGTTSAGGANGSGIAFEIPAAAPLTLSTLATFSPAAGAKPGGTLVADAAGNLYGTTTAGGSTGLGTVFELSGTTHQTLTTLATFNVSSGYNPYAGLAIDAAGDLFGVTTGGGTQRGGTVFELSGATRQTLTVLSDLAGGSAAYGGLATDAAGNLYGTTSAGGSNGSGTVFELSNAGFVLPPVTVPDGANYQFPLPTSAGITVTAVLGLNLSTGATATLRVNKSLLTRQLLYIGVDGFIVPLRESGHFALARLDLGNNDLDLSADGPGNGINNLTTVTARVAQGYDGGDWNGSGGIVSSAAAADQTRTTALGVIQNDQGGSAEFTAANPFDGTTPGPDDTLVKFTYYGDANLDGKVDGSDYGQIDAGFLSGGTLTGWFYGDFNYDGSVDAADYTLIDNGFNTQGPRLSTAVVSAGPTAEVAAAAVPEPPGIAAGVAAAGSVVGRRRGRRCRLPPSH